MSRRKDKPEYGPPAVNWQRLVGRERVKVSGMDLTVLHSEVQPRFLRGLALWGGCPPWAIDCRREPTAHAS
jgi:hypothetical protein